MLTQLIEGETPLPIDPEILAVAADQPHNPHPGRTHGIAILNASGRLYRVLGAQSPQETSQVVQALCSKHGLLDRVGFDNARFFEVDTITGRPLDTQWSAVLQLGREPHPIPAVPRLRLGPV